MSEHVEGSYGQAGRVPLLPEALGQPLRVDRPSELVGKDEVGVDVRLARESLPEQLCLPVFAQRLDRS